MCQMLSHRESEAFRTAFVGLFVVGRFGLSLDAGGLQPKAGAFVVALQQTFAIEGGQQIDDRTSRRDRDGGWPQVSVRPIPLLDLYCNVIITQGMKGWRVKQSGFRVRCERTKFPHDSVPQVNCVAEWDVEQLVANAINVRLVVIVVEQVLAVRYRITFLDFINRQFMSTSPDTLDDVFENRGVVIENQRVVSVAVNRV